MSASSQYATSTLKVFKALAVSLKHYKAPMPSGDEDEQRLHIKSILDKIKELPNVLRFLDNHIGKSVNVKPVKSGRAGAVRLLAQYLGGKYSMGEMSEKARGFFQRNYEARSLYRGQKPLLVAIPEEIRTYLPPKIVVKLDNAGYIKEITDMYDNVSYGLLEKITAQQQLLREYKSIEKKIKVGLTSKDETARYLSTIMGIIMETGIRPGNRSNGIKEILDKGEVKKETFGAITLKRQHIKVKEGEIQLQFPGKKGTLNNAVLLDKKVIRAVADIAEGLEPEDYLFGDLDYDDLSAYFNKNFKGLRITDFRKLRATKEVFEGLKAEQTELFKRIKSFVDLEVKEQEAKVIKEIVRALKKVHTQAQVALSHESSKTTEKSYINPQVLLAFLSRGGLLPTLEECVLSGKTKLEFNPLAFIQNANKIATLRYPITTKCAGLDRCLSDILFDLVDSI